MDVYVYIYIYMYTENLNLYTEKHMQICFVRLNITSEFWTYKYNKRHRRSRRIQGYQARDLKTITN